VPIGSSSERTLKTARDLGVLSLAGLASAGALWWLARVGPSGLAVAGARLAHAVTGVLLVSGLVLMGLWLGLVYLLDRRLRRDWRSPGVLHLTCLTLGTLTCSCFAAAIALVMAGFAGAPAVSTTVGPVTYEGGTGWPALDRLAEGALRAVGWSAALVMSTLSLLGWLGVVVGLCRLARGRPRPTGR
jgi:hypothetical protein